MARNLFRYHPTIGYQYIPNLRARVRHEGGGYLVRTNAQGFRCDWDFAPEKPQDEYRILLFGDSYSAGEGVSNGLRFGDLLESLVPGVKVYNFALPGTGTDQQMLAYRECAEGIEHDLLMICPMAENVRRNVQPYRMAQSAWDGRLVKRAKPYFELANGALELKHQPVPKTPLQDEDDDTSFTDTNDAGAARRVVQGLTAAIDDKLPGFHKWTQKVRRLALPEEYNEADHPAWLLMKEILKTWISGHDRAPVLLCPLPTFGHIHGHIRSEPFTERFQELVGECDVQFHDLLPGLAGLDETTKKDLRFAVDEHPTKRCHAEIAKQLAPVIERLGKERS